MSENGRDNSFAPCKGCEEREVGCHARCAAYTEWKTEHDRRKKEEYDAKKGRETLSHGALRKIWKNMRWNRRGAFNRSGFNDR